MIGAETGAVVAVEVLVEEQEVAPVRILLELLACRRKCGGGRRLSRVNMPIMRFATSRAMSAGVIALPPDAGAFTLNSGPNASENFANDSISRYDVGNQIGPRQFELPPLIFTSASAGS